MNTLLTYDDLASVAMQAALETEGVHDMASGLTESLSRSLLGFDKQTRGVRVTEERDGIAVDVYVLVTYGADIPVVAWNIQEQVKHALEELSDVVIAKVNIHIQGVGFDELE